MNKTDLQLFGGQLNALAETFDKKPVSVKAMEVWFETLKEFPTERVMDVVNHWAKYHGKFPTPAEVWKQVNERMIDVREEQTRIDKARFARETNDSWVTQQGSEIIAGIYQTLGVKMPAHLACRVPGEDDE